MKGGALARLVLGAALGAALGGGQRVADEAVLDRVRRVEARYEAYTAATGPPKEVARHVPVLEQVGAAEVVLQSPHVMDREGNHTIDFVYVRDEDSGEVVFFADLLEPYFHDHVAETFALPGDSPERTLRPFSFCNKHHLWQGEPLATVSAASWNRTMRALARLQPVEPTCDAGPPAFATLLPSGHFGASFNVSADKQFLLVTMTFPADTWLAIGFNSQTMVPPLGHGGGVDVLACGNLGQETACLDLHSTSSSRVSGPVLDTDMEGGKSDVQVLTEEVTETVTVTVQKRLVGNDGLDADLSQALGNSSEAHTEMIFAAGTMSSAPSDAESFLAYHGLGSRGTFSMNMQGGSAPIDVVVGGQRSREFKIVHGVLMYTIWGVLITLGSVIARYQRHTEWWMGAHRAVQAIATLLTLPVFLLTFSWQSESASKAHKAMGLAIVFTSWVQALCGSIMYALARVSSRVHSVASLTLSGATLEELRSLDKKYGSKDVFHAFASEKGRMTASVREELEAYLNEFLDAYIRCVPLWVTRAVAVHFRQHFARPFHRIMGCVLPLVAYAQIYVGVSLLEMDVLLRGFLYFWTSVVGVVVIYKEVERRRGWPPGLGRKMQLAADTAPCTSRGKTNRQSKIGGKDGLQSPSSARHSWRTEDQMERVWRIKDMAQSCTVETSSSRPPSPVNRAAESPGQGGGAEAAAHIPLPPIPPRPKILTDAAQAEGSEAERIQRGGIVNV